MRVLFAGGGTGGHLYPGLAIARALIRLEPEVKPFFVGARRGIERTLLPSAGFDFELLDLHPLYRSRPWRNWQTLRGAAASWRRLSAILKELKPLVAVGTGGYAAALAIARANAAGIATVLQEQNSYPGLTMKLLSRFAREVYLGFPEAASHLPRGRQTRFIDTGNPIERPPANAPAAEDSRARWAFTDPERPVLLVVGGSQGAAAINRLVAAVVDMLAGGGIYVIWATGAAQFDEYEHLQSESVRIRPYLEPIADAYAVADLALSRAGAITTAELCAWGIPSVIVPLPTAASDHQTANALALESAGCSIMLRQADLTSEQLVTVLLGVFGDPAVMERMALAARERGRPEAAEVIASRILELCVLK